MAEKKKRAIVVCPGRGSYTNENLGSLAGVRGKNKSFLSHLDEQRIINSEISVSELDGAEKFKTGVHTKGENASALIYACAKMDFMSIEEHKFDIVAIAGNSMGWYLTLSMAETLDWDGSYKVINTMGSMMKDRVIGGQVIYPIVNDDWVIDPSKQGLIERVMTDINSQSGSEVYISIRLGGYIVLGGNKEGIVRLLKELPQDGDFPFQLINHGAFHTPLMKEVRDKAFNMIDRHQFGKPTTSMIDGRGHIYSPHNVDIEELYQYTLGHQVTETYDFTKSISVALKEFAPDCLILLGPGNSLGGAIGQVIIENNWLGISNKEEFVERQKNDPFLLSMGMPEQKKLVLA